ncbi:MAG: helix-turn-helix domain-containing protein [Planctomycetota bacterium]
MFHSREKRDHLIVALREDGYPPWAIVEALGVGRSTVWRVLKKYRPTLISARN